MKQIHFELEVNGRRSATQALSKIMIENSDGEAVMTVENGQKKTEVFMNHAMLEQLEDCINFLRLRA